MQNYEQHFKESAIVIAGNQIILFPKYFCVGDIYYVSETGEMRMF